MNQLDHQLDQLQNQRAGAVYGYARVSTDDQDCTIQYEALVRAGCTIIREEKRSGTTREGRVELETLLTFLRPGDTLVVTRIDRLARSMYDLQNIVYDLRAKQVALRATEQPIDTSSSIGKAFLDMLGVFAEFETNLRRERQMEGIRKAKANGVYRGRASIKEEKVEAILRDMAAGQEGPQWISEKHGVSRMTIHRFKSKYAKRIAELREELKEEMTAAA